MSRARALAKDRNKKAKAKPTVFVGSSSEASGVVGAIEMNLDHFFQVTPWPAGVFTPGRRPLTELVARRIGECFGVDYRRVLGDEAPAFVSASAAPLMLPVLPELSARLPLLPQGLSVRREVIREPPRDESSSPVNIRVR